MSNMNKVKGFTLIELLIVMVLLGLFAVTAIPKYLDLTEKAQQANIEGMAGGFATGISLARAQWEAEGRPSDGINNVVDYDGSDLLLTKADKANGVRAGYAIGLSPGDVTLTANDCVDIWNNILQQPPLATATLNELNGIDADRYKYFATVVGSGPLNYCTFFLKETLHKSDQVYRAPVDETIGNNFTYQPANSSVVININKTSQR